LRTDYRRLSDLADAGKPAVRRYEFAAAVVQTRAAARFARVSTAPRRQPLCDESEQEKQQMIARPFVRSATRVFAAAAGLSVAAYAAYVAHSWRTYGNPPAPKADEMDDLLDQFMPEYDVVERHSIVIAAPSAVVLEAARKQDLLELPLVSAIFKVRELALGAAPGDPLQPRGLLAAVQSLGWGMLAERPGREIVMGAVTRPWEPNVTFRALSPKQFAAYRTPGEVKIVWTLRADPAGDGHSVFRTETRAEATDPVARDRFRNYWSFVSPGVFAIRWLSLQPLKREAERRMEERKGVA
jgi:hypothetical protein